MDNNRKSVALSGIGPAGKTPADYLTERDRLRQLAVASRNVERQRERCLLPSCKADALWIEGDVWADPDVEAPCTST